VSASDPDRLVRPYLITGGRTRPVDELAIEALIETTAAAHEHSANLRFEPQQVVALCRTPVSIAEIAARISVPLGVAKVIVADLAADGLLTIHGTASAEGPSVPLLERLLDGLSSC
jgi:hypothetical protein